MPLPYARLVPTGLPAWLLGLLWLAGTRFGHINHTTLKGGFLKAGHKKVIVLHEIVPFPLSSSSSKWALGHYGIDAFLPSGTFAVLLAQGLGLV